MWEVATESVIATGIIFLRCAPDLYEACEAALEIDGFPVVGSLKVNGVDKGLSKAAIERPRLMKLYRTSRDTKAIMALFLYGAYKFSKDGMGQSMFPLWYTGETYEKVLDILCKECLPQANRTAPCRWNYPLVRRRSSPSP